MPYQTIRDLPKPVQDRYGPKQLAAFLAAFNSALTQYDNDESRAFAVAHHAAQQVGDKAIGIKFLANNRFLAFYTNPYQDRDGEWFAEKAIDEDLERMQTTGNYPELWFYHIPGTAFGKVDTVFKVARFAVALGHVYDTPVAQALKAYAEKGNYALSHGFEFNPESFHDNTYHDFQTFEISVLPADKASNPYTAFLPVPKLKGGFTLAIQDKAVREAQLTDLVNALAGIPEAELKAVLEGVQTASKTLDATIGHKEGPLEAAIELETEQPEAEGMDIPTMVKTMMKRMDMLEQKMAGMAAPSAPAPMEVKSTGDYEAVMAAIKSLSEKVDSNLQVAEERAKSIQLADLADVMMDARERGNNQKAYDPEFDANNFVSQMFGGKRS